MIRENGPSLKNLALPPASSDRTIKLKYPLAVCAYKGGVSAFLVDNKVHWKVGGPAGQGVKSSGIVFARACTRAGLSVFGYPEYPNLIKGGHSTYQVRVEDETVLTLIRHVNMLVALDRDTIFLHCGELAHGAAIIYDDERVKLTAEELGRPDVRLISVPALKICRELKVSEIMENQAFLGASFALLSCGFSILEDAIRAEFAAKGADAVREDVAAARAGYDYVCKNHDYDGFPHSIIPLKNAPQQMIVTGNEALSMGAVKAGCKFYAAYPMTPASSILQALAGLQREYGLVVKHAEDENSVINLAVGAGYAGVRAMCGTSGGGFALMSEGYSLAAMTETPVVIVEAMRGGPATGLPTWTGQEDLKFVLSAGHGEFPRFVLAPGDPEECFYLTAEAFNIAEEYQTPVVIITDKYLAESHWSCSFFNKHVPVRRGSWASDGELAAAGARWRRYSLDAPGGVSRRVVPGQHKNGIFIANSEEHDEYGYSSEDAAVRERMSRKRLQKADSYKAVMPSPSLYGPAEAQLTVICWGSTKTAARQAMRWLNGDGYAVNVLHLTHLAPFPDRAVAELLGKGQLLLDVEHNATAQLAGVIREHTGIRIEHHLLRNDGRPILPEQLADKARQLLGQRKGVGS